MAIASIVGTVGSTIVGGAMQSSAASDAADAQERSVSRANAQEQKFFDETKEQLQPFISTGHAAANKLSDLEGLDGGNSASAMSALQGLPGYQFANQQGLKSVQNSATARGLGVSGAALKGASTYSTGLANQYYNNLLTGIQNTENTGESAGASLGGVASSIGQSIGANTIGGGNARAASEIAQGNAIANAAAGVPSSFLTGALYKGFGNAGGDENTGIYGTTGQPQVNSSSLASGGDGKFGFGSIGNGFQDDWYGQGY